jgi:4-amino-4-deoxy-L-arabinose transferase-like glycosyltransferase
MRKKPLVIALVSIFCVAFGIRLYFALHSTAVPNYSDMAWYNKVAHQSGFPKELPPAYPLMLRAIYRLCGTTNYRAVFIVQGLFGALTAALVCWITSRVGTLKAGITAGGIAAIYPNFIVYGLTTLTETFGVFSIALLSAVLVAAIGERKRSILAVLMLLFGAAFRPVILFFAPGVFLSVKKRLTFVVACAVIVVPVIAYELSVGLTFHRAAIALYETYYPKLNGTGYIDPNATSLGSDTLSNAVYVKAALDNIRRDRWRVVGNIYNKAAVLFSRGWDKYVMDPIVSSKGNTAPFLHPTHKPPRDSVRDSNAVSTTAAYVMEYAYIPIMLLGFIGMARLYEKKNRMLTLPALSYVILMILVCIFKYRYRLLIEPIMIIYASLFLWRARPRLPGEDAPPGGGPAGWSRPRDWIVVSAMCCVTLALRLYAMFTYPPSSNAWQATQLKSVASRGAFTSNSAPLYPLFVRAAHAGFGAAADRAVFMTQALLGASVVALMYATAARLGNRRAGFIAAGVSAVYPAFIGYGLGIRVEWLTVILVTLLMAVSARTIVDRMRTVISTVIVGVAMLAQPTLTWLTPGAVVAAKRRAVFLGVLIVIIAPFTIGNAVREHRISPVYTPWALGVSLGNFNWKSGWSTIDRIYDSANNVVTRGPMAGNVGGDKSLSLERGPQARYLYVVFMLLGFIGLARYYRRNQRGVVLPVMLYIAVLVVFSNFEITLRVPLEPLLILYASILLAGGLEWSVPATQGRESDPPLT